MNEPSSARHGIWGAIAPAAGPRLARALVDELDEGLALLARLPPAVTFFGGARVRADDPFYAAAERMGELLADADVPPRTGAGPGIMAAVPEGFRRRQIATGKAVDPGPGGATPARGGARGQALTQGFNIVLPFEQHVNPAIDVSMELAHFPTRKLVLYQNSLGLVIFPGGFGTLDELLEVWRLKVAGRLDYPFVLFGRDFWRPLAAGLREAAAACPGASVTADALAMLSWTDDPAEAMRLAVGDGRAWAGEEPLGELGARIAHELVEGLAYLEGLSEAVTVLGGARLDAMEPTLRVAERLAERLALAGVPTRAAGPGQLSVALARGGHRGAAYLPQQAFGMRRADARNLYGADRVHLVNDRLTHKVLLTENARALVALPGGLGTLDELFSVLCQLQTRKIPARRVVLVGAAFWRPLLAAIRAVMLDGSRRTISEADLDLVTVTDDADEAAKLALAPPPELAPKLARG